MRDNSNYLRVSICGLEFVLGVAAVKNHHNKR
jgi:hypothetical protein